MGAYNIPPQPRTRIASMFVDQFPLNDLARSMGAKHEDGLRVTHVLMTGHVREYSLALRTRPNGQIHAARVVVGDASNFYASFARLNRSVEELFLTGRTSIPAERALLATGAIAAAMRALHSEGERIETPELAIRYQRSS